MTNVLVIIKKIDFFILKLIDLKFLNSKINTMFTN